MKLSIVIPTLNRVGLLRRTLESALEQEGEDDYEVVVLDNCSEDGTWAFLQSVIDPRLRVFRNSDRLNMGPNWNKAVRLSQGDLIYMLQDDDVALPNLAGTVCRCAVEHPEVSLMCFATCLIENDENERVYFWQPKRKEILPPPSAFRRFARRWTLSSTQVIFARAVYNEFGPFDETAPIMSDAEAFLRWMLHARALVSPEVIALRRYWSGSVTTATQFTPAMMQTMRYLVESIPRRAVESGLLSTAQVWALKRDLHNSFIRPFAPPGRWQTARRDVGVFVNRIRRRVGRLRRPRLPAS